MAIDATTMTILKSTLSIIRLRQAKSPYTELLEHRSGYACSWNTVHHPTIDRVRTHERRSGPVRRGIAPRESTAQSDSSCGIHPVSAPHSALHPHRLQGKEGAQHTQKPKSSSRPCRFADHWYRCNRAYSILHSNLGWCMPLANSRGRFLDPRNQEGGTATRVLRCLVLADRR